MKMKTSNLLRTAFLTASIQVFARFSPYTAAAAQGQLAESPLLTHPAQRTPTFPRQPTYFERFEQLSRTLSQARDMTSQEKIHFQKELHDVVGELSSLSPAAVQEAVLAAIEELSPQELGDVSKSVAGRLQDGQQGGLRADPYWNYTVSKLCLNHTAAIVKGFINSDYWAIQSKSLLFSCRYR